MVEITLLTDEERDWASKHDYNLDNLTNEIAKEIKQKMKEEKESKQPEPAPEPAPSQPEPQNGEQKEENKDNSDSKEEPTTTVNKELTVVEIDAQEKQQSQNQEQQPENTNENAQETATSSIALYNSEFALGFFKRYAEVQGWDFNHDPIVDGVAGDFTDANDAKKGRVSVKDDNAASDIKGIEALVLYAQQSGYESITLGACSEEYAAEMKRICEENNMTLVFKNRANAEQNRTDEQEEKAIPLPDGSERLRQENTQEQANEPITVEESGVAMPTYKITPIKAQMDLKKYLREASTSPEAFKAELDGKTKNFEQGYYDVLGPAGKEKACADILLQQYASEVHKNADDKKLQQIEMALKMYGLESITLTPQDEKVEPNVTIQGKDFKERTAEEQAQIKVCHDASVPSKKAENDLNKGPLNNQKDVSRDR